jgi:hypothetical protein
MYTKPPFMTCLQADNVASPLSAFFTEKEPYANYEPKISSSSFADCLAAD